MDRPIAAGDLVMVVRPTPCCGNCDSLGVVFKVVYVSEKEARYCNLCKAQRGIVSGASPVAGKLIDMSRLIRIDPPALADEKRQDERLTA